jgi:4-amino-4-deoxy-L-arabinose transferase-like glycosyltransferase
VLAVAAPWYVYEGIKQPAFLQTFLLREPLGHLHGGLARNDAWWGQVKNLIVGFYPWVAFLPAAVVQALRREGIENRQQSAIEPASPGDCTGLDLLDCSAARRAARREVLAFSAWWALTVVVAFSLAGAKLPHYLAPAFPPMALLIAAWSESWVGGRAGTRLSEAVGFGLLGLIGLLLAGLAGIAVLMPAVVRERLALQFGCWTPGPAPVVMLTALAAGSLGAVGAAMAGRRRAVFPVLAVAMVAALIAHVGWLKPRLALIQSQPRKELAQFAGAALPADEPLGVFYAKRNATIFYARRPIVDLGEWDPGKLVSFLCTPTPATALTHAKFLPLLEEKLPGVELWTRRGEYVLVANHELSWRGADRGGPAAEGTAGTAFTAKTQRWQEHAPAQQSEDVKPQIAQIAQNRGVSPRPGLRQQATEGTAGTAFTAKVPKPAYGGPGWRPPKAA